MSTQVVIDKVAVERIAVTITGTMPLIVHRFSEKAKREILDRGQGKKNMKVARDPESEYQASFYRIDRGDDVDRFGFPVTAFKAATVGAARFYGKDVKMTELRQFMFFRGELTPGDPQQLVEIAGEPEMREDVVRLSGPGRAPDMRYRPMFMPWSAVLDIQYVTSSLSRDSVLSLIDAGGMGVGVGEWRPEKRGEFGTYQVSDVAILG